MAEGVVQNVEIHSEAGGELRLLRPAGWRAARVVYGDAARVIDDDVIVLTTTPGETVRMSAA